MRTFEGTASCGHLFNQLIRALVPLDPAVGRVSDPFRGHFTARGDGQQDPPDIRTEGGGPGGSTCAD